MEEIEKKLNLMKYWLFGTYAIVSAAVTAFLYTIILEINGLNPDFEVDQFYQLPVYWFTLVGFAVLLIIFFVIYKAIIDKDQTE